MTDPIVSLKDVGKRYVKYDDVPLLVTRALKFRAMNRRSHIWAVRNVDLEVDAGESVGVIGRNGSGKSTLFQMLAGVTAPTEGTVRVRGRVAPLISVGIGFHPELTGRENVYVNGMILGLTKSQVDKRFDSILHFAEIEEFIDTPVKFYSSGMFVRLGFAVAVASDPELLLVDEVLAVGDLSFQAKCFDRMEAIRRNGATILVVSHNLNAIRRLCSRTMVMHDGSPLFLGDTDDAISKYHDVVGKLEGSQDVSQVRIESFELRDARGMETGHVRPGDEIVFRARIAFAEPTTTPLFLFQINKESGQNVYSENTLALPPPTVGPDGIVTLDVRLSPSLPTGSYMAQVAAGMSADPDGPKAVSKPIAFFFEGRPWVKGANDLQASFEFNKPKAVARPARPRRRVARQA